MASLLPWALRAPPCRHCTLQGTPFLGSCCALPPESLSALSGGWSSNQVAPKEKGPLPCDSELSPQALRTLLSWPASRKHRKKQKAPSMTAHTCVLVRAALALPHSRPTQTVPRM